MEDRDRFVLGLTGSLGSGCSTIANILQSNNFQKRSLSKPIKDKFKKIHSKDPTLSSYGPNWRIELQEIGNLGRKGEYSESERKSYLDYWIDTALTDLDDNQNVVIDGIRNKGEVEALRKRFSQFWLVAVCADYSTRWKRVEKLDIYTSERDFQKDDQRDSHEEEITGQNVQDCVYEADYVFINEENLVVKRQIEEVLGQKIKEAIEGMVGRSDYRRPFDQEVFMATAVSQSHASQCLKRRVGALIVDESKKIPISVGYNDNPIGMQPCHSHFHDKCYKDIVMESKLENMGPIYCPKCGTRHERLAFPWKCTGKIDGSIDCNCNFKKAFFPSRNIELCTAIHAEERAIRSLNGRSAEGCTLYVNTFPCFQCARYIKDAEIKKVVYVEAYPIKEAEEFLRINGVEIKRFEGFKPRVFNKVFKQIE